eukprot:761072-Hanusia_phi.AAC.2
MAGCSGLGNGNLLPPASSSSRLSHPAADPRMPLGWEEGLAEDRKEERVKLSGWEGKRQKNTTRVRRVRNQTGTALKSKNLCLHQGCTTSASYGEISNRIAVACAKHRKEGEMHAFEQCRSVFLTAMSAQDMSM